MTLLKTTSLFIVFLLTILAGCVKEEFIKACYDDTSIGCQNLDTNGVIIPIDSNKINFLNSSVSKDEDEGLASVFITLSQPAESTIVIPFVVTGTLKTNDDVIISGTGVSYNSVTKTGTLTLTTGQSYLNIFMTIVNDTVYEATENLMIILSSPSGKAVLGTETTFTLSVTDNDNPPWISFDVATTTGVNESAGTIPVTINLEYALEDEVEVPILVTGTANKSGMNADHTYDESIITVPAGVTSFNILIPFIDDTSYEGNETIIITIDSIGNPLTVGAETVHTITLEDNDAIPTVEFDIAASSANESQGTVAVTINLSHAVQVAQQVKVSYSGTSDIGDDYTGSTTVTIPVGDTTANLTLNLINDSLYEVPETIEITLEVNPLNNTYGLGAPTLHTVTLSDDDPEPTLRFDYELLSYHADEAEARVKILTDTAAGSDITVYYNLAGSVSAPHVPGSNIGSNSITLPAEQTEIDLVIVTNVTSADPNNLNIILTLEADPNYNIGSPSTTQINILNPRFIQIPQDMTFGQSVLLTNKTNEMIVISGGYAIATDVGLVITNENFTQIRTYGSSRGLPSNKIQSLYYDEDMQTLIVGTDAGAAIARYNHFSSFTKLSNSSLSNITGVMIDGETIVLTSNIGMEISNDIGQTFNAYNVGTCANLVPSNNITKLIYEKSGEQFYFATFDKGVVLTTLANITASDPCLATPLTTPSTTIVNTATVNTPNNIDDKIVDMTLSEDKLRFYALVYNNSQAKVGVYSATLASPLAGTFIAYSGFTSAQIRSIYYNNNTDKVYLVGTSRVSDGTTSKTSTLVSASTVTFSSMTGGRSFAGKDFIFNSTGILRSSNFFSAADRYSASSDFPTNWAINTMVEFDNSYLIGTDQGIYQIPLTLDDITKLSVDSFKINQLKVSPYHSPIPTLFVASDAGWSMVEDLQDFVDNLVTYEPFAPSPNQKVTAIAFDDDEDFIAIGNPNLGLKLIDTSDNSSNIYDLISTPSMFSNKVNDIVYAYNYDSSEMPGDEWVRSFLIATDLTLHQLKFDSSPRTIRNIGISNINTIFNYESVSNAGVPITLFNDGTTLTFFENAIQDTGSFVVDNQVDIINTSFNSPSNIFRTLFDVDDVLHVGHDKGYSMQPDTGSPFVNYTSASGLPSVHVKTILRTNDNKIILGTNTGLCISTDEVSIMALD
jgi:hypothetical protein